MSDKQISEQELSQIKKDVLKVVFPTECDLVSESDLEKMLNGPIELRHVSTGALLNFHDVYQTIAGAVDFLNNCLSIYVSAGGLIKKETPAPKLIEELLIKTTITTINKDEKQIIVEEIEKHVKRYA